MAQYIPLDALVAKIDNLIDKGKHHDNYQSAFRDGNNAALYALKGYLNTLEVKEVDIRKELEKFIEHANAWIKDNWKVEFNNGTSFNHIYDLEMIAKHFFELGIKVAQKGE